MIKKKIFVYFGLIFLLLNTNSNSLENKIIVKIENQIITSLDINNELRYLIALNPNLKNSKKKDILEISKRSVIQEKIKKIEIQKNFNNPQIQEEFLRQIIKNVYSRIGFKNLEDFKKYLIKNDINYENIKNKLEIEALWNELILIKFSSRVKINEKELRERVKNNKKILKSYLLSNSFRFETSK